MTGDVTGDVTGDTTGDVTGDTTGDVTGDVTGDTTGDVDADVDDDTTGDTTGDVDADVNGDVAGDVAGDVTGDVTGDAASFIVVEVTSVSFSLPSPSPFVHLREQEQPYRGIEFPVGLVEAQSIAMALEKETAPRPSSHDLLSSVIVAAGCDVIAVRLTGSRDGTLLAELDLMTPRGREVLDCRPSDGIAVALRQTVPSPILSEESLLE